MIYKVKALGIWYEVPYSVYRSYKKNMRRKVKCCFKKQKSS